MKINIIEMQYEDGYWDTDMFTDIKFCDSYNGLELVKKANEIYSEGLGEEERTSSEMIKNWYKDEKDLAELVKQLQDGYIDEEDLESFETIEDFMYED